jgi:excisionase family DNA binding protein
MEKMLVDTAQACEVLGLGRSTVLALAYSGQLPSVTVGRRRLFPLEGLRVWARRLQVEQTDQARY